jgi:hypothetical protein
MEALCHVITGKTFADIHAVQAGGEGIHLAFPFAGIALVL